MTKTKSHLPAAPKQALQAFGKLLALCRKERQWRQIDIANRIGISRQTIARIEKGDPSISIGLYFAAAWLLDLPIFPGVESDSSSSSQALNKLFEVLFEVLKDKYPQRIIKPEKKIENDF